MFSIPNIPNKYKVTINGKISKLYQNLIKEIIKITLYKERVSNNMLRVEAVILNQKEMAEYNLKYLKKEGPTDIISIAYEEDPKNPNIKILGSILLCPKIIKEDSEQLKKDCLKHFTHLLVHGTLHLLGYNHEKEEERKRMEQKEVNVLSFLGIESPYL